VKWLFVTQFFLKRVVLDHLSNKELIVKNQNLTSEKFEKEKSKSRIYGGGKASNWYRWLDEANDK